MEQFRSAGQVPLLSACHLEEEIPSMEKFAIPWIKNFLMGALHAVLHAWWGQAEHLSGLELIEVKFESKSWCMYFEGEKFRSWFDEYFLTCITTQREVQDFLHISREFLPSSPAGIGLVVGVAFSTVLAVRNQKLFHLRKCRKPEIRN